MSPGFSASDALETVSEVRQPKEPDVKSRVIQPASPSSSTPGGAATDVPPHRRRRRNVIVPSIALLTIAAVAAMLMVGCSAEQRRDLGEADVMLSLQTEIEDVLDDNNLELDGDMACTSDLDSEPNVAATCEGTTTSGKAFSGTYDGAADVDDIECSVELTIVIAGSQVVNESNVNCFA